MSANNMAEKLARRLRDIMGEFNDDRVGVEILVRQLADYRRAHLTQPAQLVDAEKVREVIARVAADNQKSALTLGVEGLRGQCIETAKELHKLTAALQEKGNGAG